MRPRSRGRPGWALALLGALLPATLSAQGARITGVTTARYIDILTFRTDSVSVDSTTGTGSLRDWRGLAVQCTTGNPFCRFQRSGPRVSTVPFTQDLELSAWGLGQGIQLYAQLRGRMAGGSADEIWPQATDHFDALAAYVEMDRERFRARLGRQFKSSGLGYYNFDGGSIVLRARPDLTVEAFGGWGLVRGQNEYYTTSAISAVDALPPPENSYIFGFEARGRLWNRLSLGGVYQRELATDRSGLYSERIAVDASARVLRRGSVDGELQYDIAAGSFNQIRLRGTHPVWRRVSGMLEYRHYEPFFELWTIWGAFTPVGYDEANAGAFWGSDRDQLSLQLRGGWRRYQETNAGVSFAPMKREGWRVTADGSWLVAPAWRAHGGVHTEIGFGASRTDGDVGVRWEPGARGYIGARATAWQSSYELRLGTGTIYGAGLEGGVRVYQDVRVLGDVATYRHTYDDGAPWSDWSQLRGSLRLEWTVGRDPGMRGGVR